MNKRGWKYLNKKRNVANDGCIAVIIAIWMGAMITIIVKLWN